jgi:hypothetical protein
MMTERLDRNSHQVVIYRLALLSLSWGERSLVPESLFMFRRQNTRRKPAQGRDGRHIGTNSVELRY